MSNSCASASEKWTIFDIKFTMMIDLDEDIRGRVSVSNLCVISLLILLNLNSKLGFRCPIFSRLFRLIQFCIK